MNFDIDFDHDLFLVYIQELHHHLFGEATFKTLLEDVYDHHQKHHLVTLHLIKDKETFYFYYNQREKLEITSIFDIIIGALTENTKGNKIKEYLVAYLDVSSSMITDVPDEYGKKVFMKNLKSFMAYARKRKDVYHQSLNDKEDV